MPSHYIAFIIVVLGLVAKFGRMYWRQKNAHLTIDEIRRYKTHRRSLSQDHQRRITNHVGICDECKDQFMAYMMNEGV